jgi:hypothetical protein
VGIVVVVLDVDVLLLVELVVGSVVLELVEVVVVLVDVVAPFPMQVQALPSPAAAPPAAAHDAASGAMPACPGWQQTTASGRPHVDRKAQPTTARRLPMGQPALRSVFA